jgi:hypothetical protein
MHTIHAHRHTHTRPHHAHINTHIITHTTIASHGLHYAYHARAHTHSSHTRVHMHAHTHTNTHAHTQTHTHPSAPIVAIIPTTGHSWHCQGLRRAWASIFRWSHTPRSSGGAARVGGLGVVGVVWLCLRRWGSASRASPKLGVAAESRELACRRAAPCCRRQAVGGGRPRPVAVSDAPRPSRGPKPSRCAGSLMCCIAP